MTALPEDHDSANADAGPSYETQSRLPGSALKKVPDSNARDDHEDQDYEPNIHLLPLTSLTVLRHF
jgi:hypothetical protein